MTTEINNADCFYNPKTHELILDFFVNDHCGAGLETTIKLTNKQNNQIIAIIKKASKL